MRVRTKVQPDQLRTPLVLGVDRQGPLLEPPHRPEQARLHPRYPAAATPLEKLERHVPDVEQGTPKLLEVFEDQGAGV